MNAIEVLRWVFSYILTPTAVVGVVAVIVLNVLKIVRDGFQEDVREGAQRVSAAILPFAFLLYATVRSYVPHESWVELGQLIRTIPAWQLFLGSAGAGALLAAEMFHVTPTHRLLMRMLVLAQSAVACFIGYVFVGVASSVGIDVAMGVLVGFCGYSIFPNRDWTREDTMSDTAFGLEKGEITYE